MCFPSSVSTVGHSNIIPLGNPNNHVKKWGQSSPGRRMKHLTSFSIRSLPVSSAPMGKKLPLDLYMVGVSAYSLCNKERKGLPEESGGRRHKDALGYSLEAFLIEEHSQQGFWNQKTGGGELPEGTGREEGQMESGEETAENNGRIYKNKVWKYTGMKMQ